MYRTLLAAVLAWAADASAAPVPPPPPLSAEMLTGGAFRYEYGTQTDGFICFSADGTYCAKHDPAAEFFYVGAWRIRDGAVLVLDERGFNPETGEQWAIGRFEFTLATRPALAGTARDGTRVVLRRMP